MMNDANSHLGQDHTMDYNTMDPDNDSGNFSGGEGRKRFPNRYPGNRIKKACDSCNVRRTKCDGQSPCGHCSRTGLGCTYLRIEKKRGRASDKYPKITKRRKDAIAREKALLHSKVNYSGDKDVPKSEADLLVANRMALPTPLSRIGSQFPSSLPTPPQGISDQLFFNRTMPLTNTMPPFNMSISGNMDLAAGSLATLANNPYLQQPHTSNKPPTLAELQEDCKYPVLDPILSLINSIGLPIPVLCSLLEHYFGALLPPYLFVPMLRPCDFLITAEQVPIRQPRVCSIPLLLSIIMISALDIEHPFLAGISRKIINNRLYDAILASLPQDKSKSGLDEIITYAHLAMASPTSMCALDFISWNEMALTCALNIGLNKEHPSLDETTKEERRRTWWALYLMDRFGGVGANADLKIEDSICANLYQPCSSAIWKDASMYDLPPVEGTDTPIGCVTDIIRPGLYGFLLPHAILIGEYATYRKRFQFKKDVKPMPSEDSESSRLVLLARIDKSGKARERVKDLMSPSHYAYSELFDRILRGIVRIAPFWEPTDRIDTPVDIIKPNDVLDEIFSCVDIIADIMKHDPDMRVVPIFAGYYLFLSSFEIMSILDNCTPETLKKMDNINENPFFKRSSYIIDTLTRCIESICATVHTEYLRLIRNYLRESLRDVNRLILLNDVDETIIQNRLKRRNILSHVTFQKGGAGIAIY